jgi:hypothetical protein
MDPAGAREIALRVAQPRRQRDQCLDVDPERFRSNRRKLLPDCFDAVLAAETAARGNRAETLRRAQFNFQALSKIDNHSVPAGERNPGDVAGFASDRFGKQEAGGKLVVISRCSHCCRENFAADPNLERFLDRQLIAHVFEGAVFFSADDLSGADAALFFHLGDGSDIVAPVEICHLYISPGHNFFGHHGREPDDYPVIEVPAIECVAGRGIRGDRFLDYRENYKGQITFFAFEVFDELCRAFQLPDRSPSLVRRNVVTRDVDLNQLIGQEFEIQSVGFYGTGECRPCYWMDRALAPGAEEFLKGRGGLRATILTTGKVRARLSS